jgi:3-oxoacyl-[acyl-carrier protein] reductase
LDDVLVEYHSNCEPTCAKAVVLGRVRLHFEIMKNILVTGASRGIGRATAVELTQLGASVHATSRKGFTLQNCTTHILDHTDSDSVRTLRSALQGTQFDGLVLNAGALTNKPFRDLSIGDFNAMALANWSGPALLVQEFLPLLSPGAHIVFISSMGGFQGASKYPGLLAYATSKMAMAGLAECLQAELGPDGFVFNALCLGAVQTEMLSEAFPGYHAPVTPEVMGLAVAQFALNGHKTQAGQVIPMAMSNP